MFRARVVRLFAAVCFATIPVRAPAESVTAIPLNGAVEFPAGLAVDASGNLYVTGFSSDNVVKITPDGIVTGILGPAGDGAGNLLDGPYGIAVDGAGTVFVTGARSDNAFKVTPDGVETEIIDAAGDGLGRTLEAPFAIAFGDNGNACVAGFLSDNVFKITPDGSIKELISAGGDGLDHQLSGPVGVAVDSAGHVVVAGSGSDNVFRITLTGAVTEIINSSGDGRGNTLDSPRGLSVDASGNVYVVGRSSHNAFKIDSAGVTTVIIDAAGDGFGRLLHYPRTVAADGRGNVYVASETDHNVFTITSAGHVFEIINASGDGKGNGLQDPRDIAVDAAGRVYVLGGDSDNVFRIERCDQPIRFTRFGGCFTGPEAVASRCCDCSDVDGDGDVDLRDFARYQRTFAGNIAFEKLILATVGVGHPGNIGELSGNGVGGTGPNRVCGEVDYVYEIGKYEITAGQYTAFLNAVAASDRFGLYNPLMFSRVEGCRIRQIGEPGFFTYLVDADGDCKTDADWVNRPVNFVSWLDAARFANWLHHGRPGGAQDATSTENGSYDLSATHGYYGVDGTILDYDGLRAAMLTVVREADATWVIPTEDEWYKAAYHYNDGASSSYYDYPTGSDVLPSNNLIDPDPGNNATYWFVGLFEADHTIGRPYFRTEVGAHENSGSPYGTLDQGGNVWEWNESVLYGATRGLRGGSWNYRADSMRAADRGLEQLPDLDQELDLMGFRIAKVAP